MKHHEKAYFKPSIFVMETVNTKSGYTGSVEKALGRGYAGNAAMSCKVFHKITTLRNR
jgi:hypothetical protein